MDLSWIFLTTFFLFLTVFVGLVAHFTSSRLNVIGNAPHRGEGDIICELLSARFMVRCKNIQDEKHEKNEAKNSETSRYFETP